MNNQDRQSIGGHELAAAPAPSAGRRLTGEIALNTLADMFARHPDPDEILRQIGRTRADLRAMLGDDEISSAIETRRDAAITTPWRLEKARGASGEFFQSALSAHWLPLFTAIWNARPFGYSVIEVIYSGVEGQTPIGVKQFSEKPFEWFSPTPQGELKFFAPDGNGPAEGKVEETPIKFICARINPTYRQPYGEALLVRLYWAWYFRATGWKSWMQFLERFGDPMLVGSVMAPDKFTAAMNAAGFSNVVGVGTGETIEAITPALAGEFERLETATTKRIQKLILGQTLTSDTQGVGSQALGNIHNQVRMDKRSADITLLKFTVQSWIDAACARFFPGVTPPRFEMEDNRGLQADRAERDARMVEAGILRFTPEYLMDRYDLADGDFIVPADPNAPPPPADPADPPAQPTDAKFSAAARGDLTPEQNQIEAIADDLNANLSSPIAAGDIRAAIMAASDPADLESRLAALLDGATPRQFQRAMERALFAADVIGYVHAQPENQRIPQNKIDVPLSIQSPPINITVDPGPARAPVAMRITPAADGSFTVEPQPAAK